MKYNKELQMVLDKGISLVEKKEGLKGRFESYGITCWDMGAFSYWVEETWMGGQRFRLELWSKFDHVQAAARLDKVYFV